MNKYHVISLSERKAAPDHVKGIRNGKGRSNKKRKRSGMIKVWAYLSGFSSLSLDKVQRSESEPDAFPRKFVSYRVACVVGR
jgi:hypothetical protein